MRLASMVFPAPWADKENVVAARAGNFECALGGLLATDVAQIHAVLRGFGKHLVGVDFYWSEGFW
jgi:hypothetical protein